MQPRKRIVVVTGATGTIGAAICQRLVSDGYYVICLARNSKRGKQLVQQLGEALAHYEAVDVGDSAAVSAVFAKPVIRDNELAAVVTCAGILKMGASAGFDVAAWDQTIRTNTSGTFYVFQQALKQMEQQTDGGTLVAIGSRWAGGAKTAAAYAASKAALRGMITSLQKEYAGSAIRPLLISPGSVASPMSDSVQHDIAPELLQPADIADMVAYALSTPPRVILNEITLQAYQYDLTDQHVS